MCSLHQCKLCGYSSLNINRYESHLLSTVHMRGMTRMRKMTRRLYAFRWLECELAYQRRVCPVDKLETLVCVQQPIVDEISCKRWGAMCIVEREWGPCAKWFRETMLVVYSARFPSNGKEMESYFLECIPECNLSYLNLLATGVLNFQMLNSNMGHRRQSMENTLLNVQDSACLRQGREHEWSKYRDYRQICGSSALVQGHLEMVAKV